VCACVRARLEWSNTMAICSVKKSLGAVNAAQAEREGESERWRKDGGGEEGEGRGEGVEG